MSNIEVVKKAIMQSAPEFEKSLVSSVLSKERFTRAAMTLLLNNPNVAGCSMQSIMGGLFKCAQSSLMPDNVEAALIPYGKNLTYIPMYQGLIKLISPYTSSIHTNVVGSDDDFKYFVDGNGENIHYSPGGMGLSHSGDIVGIYCQIIFKDGSKYIERMSIEDINLVKSKSKAKGGPWKDFPVEMMKKTVFKRLYKRLPKHYMEESIQEAMQEAIKKDEEFDFKDVNKPSDEIEAVKEKSTTPQNLKAALIKDVNKPVEVIEPEEELI